MQEKILMEGVTNPLSKKGFATKNGHGILTNKRFIYSKHSLAKIMAMGVIVNATKGSYEYEIPLEDIERAETGKHMLGYALTITKKDGSILKYGIMKPLDWQIAFNNALNRDTGEGDAPTAQNAAGQTGTQISEVDIEVAKKAQKEPTGQQQQGNKNFCSNCGTKLVDGVHFCSNCGVKVH